MRSVGKGMFLFLLVLAACVVIGCSEKSTEPEKNPPPSTEMKHIWSKRFGDGDSQRAAAIAVDASGNVIVAGYFRGTVDFGGGAFSAGNEAMFVAKFGQ